MNKLTDLLDNVVIAEDLVKLSNYPILNQLSEIKDILTLDEKRKKITVKVAEHDPDWHEVLFDYNGSSNIVGLVKTVIDGVDLSVHLKREVADYNRVVSLLRTKQLWEYNCERSKEAFEHIAHFAKRDVIISGKVKSGLDRDSELELGTIISGLIYGDSKRSKEELLTLLDNVTFDTLYLKLPDVYEANWKVLLPICKEIEMRQSLNYIHDDDLRNQLQTIINWFLKADSMSR